MAEYNLTSDQKKILLDRAKRRAVLREEFLKQSTDPFRHAFGEGGVVFDPAIQRFQAMKVSQFEYFKATPKTAKYGILTFVLPMAVISYLIYKDRTDKERKFRNGEVAYADRLFKLV